MLNINDVEINIDWESNEAYVLCNEEEFVATIHEGDVDVIGDQAVYVNLLLNDKNLDSSFNILDSGHSDMSREEKEELIKQEIIGLLNEYYESIE
mgnify:FL=1